MMSTSKSFAGMACYTLRNRSVPRQSVSIPSVLKTPKRKLEEFLGDQSVKRQCQYSLRSLSTQATIPFQERHQSLVREDSPDVKLWKDFNKYVSVDGELNETGRWVAPSNIKNHLIGDPVLDWYKYFHDVKPISPHISKAGGGPDNSLNILFDMGNKFEEEVTKYLYNTHPTSVKTVMYTRSDLTREKAQETFEFMKQGVPIITQAVLYNDNNYTYGVADLIVRSDWINQLFKEPVLEPNETRIAAPKLGQPWHYRVIDIKWTTIPLCANGQLIRNTGMFPAYKGQLAIYNAVIGNLQGYTPNKAYIQGKSWKYVSKKVTYSGYDCFDRLGRVEFDSHDRDYLYRTQKAINWVRNLRANGHKWSINPPSVPELYPNMCNTYDSPYTALKKKHADEIDEITQVWMVGQHHRKYCHNNGVYKWSDPDCNSVNLGMSGTKTSKTVDKILEINQLKDSLIQPDRVTNNLHGWKTKTDLDFYIDFEAINSCFYNKDINLENSEHETGIIFMIGVGYEEAGTWQYKSFTMKDMSLDEERRTLMEFVEFINSKTKQYSRKKRRIFDETKPKLFHWANAEVSMFQNANRRHKGLFSQWFKSVDFVDFHNVFKNEPITIQGAKKFNLKEVAMAMYNNQMITTTWDSHCKGGLTAMLDSIKYYEFMDQYENKKHNGTLEPYDNKKFHEFQAVFADITRYNEIDCKTVWDIVEYIRKNNC